jgi:proteasome lid subunit RPN8/RPN11
LLAKNKYRIVGSFGNMNKGRAVSIPEGLLEAILEAAKRLYPREVILLLKGKKAGDKVVVSDLLVPPLATYGHGFSSMRTHMLPIDFSIVGTVHSHPSGNLTPSPADFNHQFGSILVIVAYPFRDESNLAAYNRAAEKLSVEIVRTEI